MFDRPEPESIGEWVDDLADQYEKAWQGVRPPCLADYLGEATGERRAALLTELTQIDLAYRAKLIDCRPAAGPPASTLRPAGESSAGTEPDKDRPIVAGYEILSELGRGGMGVVYKARQAGLKRVVALKMILVGSHAGERERIRFRTEMEAAARLQHPNIVQIYEVGEQGGRPYCALEYVDGGTLGQKLAGTPLPAHHAAELIETLARAVHFAHEHQVVHRDLKPANVLLTAAGMPKITDFGLAKQMNGASADPSAYPTQTGEILGTPSYMAPEQAAGKVHAIGPVTDIYALGAILYEMLTGRPPFKGESTLDTLEQVRSQEPVPPSHLQPRLPRDLSTICLKAMAKSPERRYPTAKELAEDLRRFLDGKPIVARPVSRAEKLWRWCRRNPMPALLISAIAVLLLAVTIGAIFASVRYADVAAAERGATAEAGRQQRQAEESGARARGERGLLLLEAGNAEGLLDLLAARQSMEADTASREPWSIVWSGWYAACRNRLQRVVGHDDEVLRVVFSPDGDLFATASSQHVQLWETVTGRPHGAVLPIPEGRGIFRDMAFSPDRKLLAVATGVSTLQLWETATSQPLNKGIQADGSINAVRISPDGKLLAAATEKETGLWETQNWQCCCRVQHRNEGVVAAGIAFSPDGSLLAIGCNTGIVRILKTATGNHHCRPWQSSPGRTYMQIMGVAFSPCGKRLVTASRDYTARLWDVDTGQPRGDVMKHKEHVWGVAFSRKGNLVATASYDGTAQLWDGNTGTPHGPPLQHEGPVAAVAFNADGSLLATCSFDTTARIWDTTTGQPIGMPLRHQGAVRSVEFKGDSSLLATASGDRTARLWRIKAENPQLWCARHNDRVYDVAFSPDGRDLLTGTEDWLVQLLDAATGVRRGQPLQLATKEFMVTCATAAFAASLAPACPFSSFAELIGERAARGECQPVVSVAISPDGRLLAAHGVPIRIWDRHSLQRRGDRVPVKSPWVTRFSPKGKLLAVGPSSAGPIHLWDLETKQLWSKLVGHKERVLSLAFTPDGRFLLSGSLDKTAVLWDVASGQQCYTLPHPESVEAVAVHPDGKLLATACWDLTVRFWGAESGQAAGPPIRYHTRIEALSFSPDGTLLAMASWDGTARLWALPVGLPCGPPYRHELVANSVAFSPDGTRLATASFDRSARLWRVPGVINDLIEIELRTHVALGARLSDQGVVEAIPWSEWQAMRDELDRWEAQP